MYVCVRLTIPINVCGSIPIKSITFSIVCWAGFNCFFQQSCDLQDLKLLNKISIFNLL